MNSVVKIDGEQLAHSVSDLSLQEEKEMKSKFCCEEEGYENHIGVCAICLKNIALQETALVKGCEHAYCVTCILRWATYREHPTCPQCKHPFQSLNVHRSLDGQIHDYMFEESVCLLLRAAWFTPLPEENSSTSETYDDLLEYYCSYEEENDEEIYYPSSSSIRICNRRWGDNGYVRAGRQEARPAHRPNIPDSGAGSSREPRMKGVAKSTIGRRAKRTLKREAANKSAAATAAGRQEESSEKLVEE